MKLKTALFAIMTAGIFANAATAQTALRLETDDFFQRNSAALSQSGLKYLEEYFEYQDCAVFEIYGYNPAGFEDPLIDSRARVVNAMAIRFDAKTKLVIRRDKSTNPEAAVYENGEYDRRIEIVPKNCAAAGVVAGGSAGGNLGIAAAGLGALLLLGGLAGGSSTSHTN